MAVARTQALAQGDRTSGRLAAVGWIERNAIVSTMRPRRECLGWLGTSGEAVFPAGA